MIDPETPRVDFFQVLSVDAIDLAGEETTSITVADEFGDEIQAITLDRPQLLRLLSGLDDLPNPVGYRRRFFALSARLEHLALTARLEACNEGQNPSEARVDLSVNELERILRISAQV